MRGEGGREGQTRLRIAVLPPLFFKLPFWGLERGGDDLSPLILTVCQIRGQERRKGRGRAAEAGSTMRFLNSNKRLPPTGRPAGHPGLFSSRPRPRPLPPPSPFDRFLPLFLQPFFVINHFPKRKVHGASDDAFARPRSGLRTTS